LIRTIICIKKKNIIKDHCEVEMRESK
jgi:hypothetical protein